MEKATFDDLLEVVRRLLGEDGCAWDRAQTPQSLLPYLIEEAYEVREAVLAGDESAVAEELGDLALHVAFQSALAEQRGAFAAADIFRAIVHKMVRRHPHVFGPAVESDAEAAPLGDMSRDSPKAEVSRDSAQADEVAPLPWEELKRRQRGGPARRGRVLEGVPAALPALLKAQRLQERASDVGFDWPDTRGPLEKAREELDELAHHLQVGSEPAKAVDAAGVEEELGDLLFAIVNVARRAGISAEAALELASSKFKRRFERIEELAAERGIQVGSAPLEELDALWDEVKLAEDRGARD